MRNYLLSCLLLVLAPPLVARGQTLGPSEPRTGSLPVEVYFSPKGGCTGAAVEELDAAKSTVLVQAYSFTAPPSLRRWSMPTSGA